MFSLKKLFNLIIYYVVNFNKMCVSARILFTCQGYAINVNNHTIHL